MCMGVRDPDFIVEHKETIPDGDREIGVIYLVTYDNEPLEVFPETLEKLKDLEKLPDPRQIIEETEKSINMRYKYPKIMLIYAIDDKAETYRLEALVSIWNTVATALEREGKIPPQLRTELRYALKLRNLCRENNETLELFSFCLEERKESK